MTTLINRGFSRRSVLGAGVALAGTLAMPAVLRAQDKSLKVGVYGGYFKDSLSGVFYLSAIQRRNARRAGSSIK